MPVGVLCVFMTMGPPRAMGSLVHVWPVQFTSKHAYIVSIIVKELVLKVNDKEQNVDVSVMVFPYKFFWYGFLVYRIEKR